MRIINAKVYTKNKKFEAGQIDISGEKITDVTVFDKSSINEPDKDLFDYKSEQEDVIDAEGLYAIPGLVDIHFHGAVGEDLCEADLAGLKKIADYEVKSGITSLCPATMSYSEDKLKGVITNLKSAMTSSDSIDAYVGLNLEGPFINPNKAGAQNRDYIIDPDIEMMKRLFEAGEYVKDGKEQNLIKLIDIAPEISGAGDFIHAFKDKAVISVAHTCASFKEATKAFEAGASHMTHLFNAMPGIGHREPGPIIAGIKMGAEAELIADGIHVHPEMIRFAFENFGADKIILISDSMEATGLENGQYQLGGQSVTKVDNKAVLTENPDTIAGSVSNLYECMRYAVQMAGIELETAIAAATINPAKSIGIDSEYGSIEAGRFANVLLVDKDLNIKKVIYKGDECQQGRF